MKSLGWRHLVVALCMLSGCLGAEDGSTADVERDDEAIVSQSDALKINPCAFVRCRAGTQCEVQEGRPVCVPSTPTPECTSDDDCRLFSNYCGGCACSALASSEPDPICKGDTVACFVDPCRNQQAGCLQGQCVIGGSF